MIKRNINGFAVQILVATSFVFALAACGGGGGGTSATPLPTAAVTITSTNAPQVAGAGFDTGKSGGGLPVGVQTSVSAPINHPPLTNIQTLAQIAQKSEQSISSAKSSPALVAGVLPNSPNTTCPGGGSLTVSVIDATSGSASFNNCREVTGEIFNGTISLSNIVADPNTVSFIATFSLSVTTTSPANTMTVSGDMTVSASLTTFAMTISGSNLTMRNSNTSFGDFALLNYSVTIDGITGYATTMTFTYSSTVVGGTATFTMSTVTPFAYTNLHIFPNTGVAIITGANSTQLRVTVLGDETLAGPSQVRLELSTDGGQNYSPPVEKTWAEISNYL